MQVTILAGGSTERAISLSSAHSVAKALDTLSYEYIIVDPVELITGHDTQKQILTSNYNVDTIVAHRSPSSKFAFNMLHGGHAEGGASQLFLEQHKLHHPGTTSTSAYTLMHKARTLQIAHQLNISTPRFYIFTKKQYRSHNKFPHIIKTLFGSGSSLGTCKIKSLSEQQEYPWDDNQQRLVLDFIHGDEYSCAILNGKIFGGCMINYAAEFCDYDVKYNPIHGLYHSPVPDNLKNACSLADHKALSLYKHLQCNGLIRFDFMIANHMPYFLEANPSPGMTSLSIVPDIAQFNHNLSYTQLIQLLLRS